ncbi:MAG: hypothetical protein JWO36_2356 [Myxococcales bacterium]|nr:hypothetical protein [Myxococcales bacterium]
MRNSLTIICLLGSVGVARAEPTAPQPWSVGVAPRVGVSIATSKLGPFVIGGLQVDVATPIAAHRLLVGVDLSVTRPSYDASAMDPRIPSGAGMYTIKETELVVGLVATYRLSSGERSFVPWVGGGPVLHMLKTNETTTLAPGDNTATSTELGVEVFGGADLRVGKGFLVGDLRLVYSKLDHPLTGSTNAGKVGIAVGYRFVF